MESRLQAKILDLKDYTDQNLAGLELRLHEHTEKVETRLLSEFWKWAHMSDNFWERAPDGSGTKAAVQRGVNSRLIGRESLGLLVKPLSFHIRPKLF